MKKAVKDWPKFKGFASVFHSALIAALYYKTEWSDTSEYMWIACHNDGEFWVQTANMSSFDKVGIQCKTLEEGIATVRALEALGEAG